MKTVIMAGVVYFGLGWLAAGAAEMRAPNAPAGPQFSIQAKEFEGCECNSVCPCLFSHDATYGNCRGMMGWTVENGECDGVDLAGVTFAVALTNSGPNMGKSMGQWTGTLYLSDKASEEQRKAVSKLVRAEFGMGFESLDEKTAPIEIVDHGETKELTIGKVGTLKIHAMLGSNGKPTTLENAPSPMAFPTMTLAIADVNTYDDGATKWSFTGRNALYADVALESKK